MKKHPPNSQILQPYQDNLEQVVGLSPKTCQDRLRDVRHFLAAAGMRRTGDLAKLIPTHMVDYLTARSPEYEPASLRNVAGSVRGFLRFAQQRGWISQHLDLAVPKIACGARNDLPVYLNAQQLELLLASWDRGTAKGRRDLAIGLCLARLGLRAGEVAGLLLEDVNWRQASLRLNQSKNGSQAQLPDLAEVGEALANYLRAGRPVCAHRQVFLSGNPPRPMSAKAVSQVVRCALARCGIEVPRPGSHLLRHTLASHLVQNGASLKEVADLLRHRHLNSASVYAHLDLPSLRGLAQPWPKEVKV